MFEVLGYAFIAVVLGAVVYLFVKLLTAGIAAISDHDD